MVLIYLNIKSQVGIYKIILNSGFAKKYPPTLSLSTSPQGFFSLSDFHNPHNIHIVASCFFSFCHVLISQPISLSDAVTWHPPIVSSLLRLQCSLLCDITDLHWTLFPLVWQIWCVRNSLLTCRSRVTTEWIPHNENAKGSNGYVRGSVKYYCSKYGYKTGARLCLQFVICLCQQLSNAYVNYIYVKIICVGNNAVGKN